MYFLGIDLGTSSLKILAMDKDGNIIDSVSRDYGVDYPQPGWSEQNPLDWYEATMEGLREILNRIDKDKLLGIGFGGQMHGLVILDEDDEVIRPVILWNDSRTEKETEYLNDVIGKDFLSKNTANIAFAGFTLPKLLWIRDNEPENFKRISKIMLPKDYLAYRLTGVHASDPSDASGTLFFDVEKRSWSKEMMDLAGIREEQLPKIYESYEAIGSLRDDIAKELGLVKDVKVAIGAGDNAAAAVGTATVGEGKCNISIGTSGTIFISSHNFSVDENNALHSFAHADGNFHLMGVVLSAGSSSKWWMEEILSTDNYKDEEDGIDKLGKNPVFFLPYLMGERSPHNDPRAKGAFIGMGMETTRKDMTQAVLEGVAFAIRDSYEIARSLGIDIERTNMCGGGAKSPLWRKILANILDLKVDILTTEEGPALGGAMLAAVACGIYPSVEAVADKVVKVKETVEPDPELVKLYDERYEIYKSLYPDLRELYRRL